MRIIWASQWPRKVKESQKVGHFSILPFWSCHVWLNTSLYCKFMLFLLMCWWIRVEFHRMGVLSWVFLNSTFSSHFEKNYAFTSKWHKHEQQSFHLCHYCIFLCPKCLPIFLLFFFRWHISNSFSCLGFVDLAALIWQIGSILNPI